MMARDEEVRIEQALRSVAGVCDHMLVGVDDKTVDRTYEIAEACGAEVFYFTFDEDFSTVRNMLLTRCPCDWALVLDGHDELSAMSRQIVPEAIKTVPLEINVIKGLVEIDRDKFGNPGWVIQQPRLIRTSSAVHYVNEVHNALHHTEEEMAEANQVVIRDFKPPDRQVARKAQRSDLNLRYFLGKVKADPRDERAWYYLGAAYLEREEWVEAIAAYRKYLKYGTWRIMRVRARMTVAQCYVQMEKYGKARQEALQALREGPERVEPLLMLAAVAEKDGDMGEAIAWMQRSTNVQMPAKFMELDVGDYTWRPWKILMHLYVKVNAARDVIMAANKVLSYMPDDESALVAGEMARKHLGLVDRRNANTRVVVVDHLATFSRQIGEAIYRRSWVQRIELYDLKQAEDATHIFVEWAGRNLVAATVNRNSDQRLVTRLHSYEAYEATLRQVRWSEVDAVVFVAEHVRDYVMGQVSHLPLERTRVIPVGADLERFAFEPEARDMQLVAWMGRLAREKGVPMLVEIARLNPDLTFVVGGEFQHGEIERYLLERSPQNLVYTGYVKRPEEFLRKPGFIVNTSVREGSPVAVAEAAAMGCVPLVHYWPGAQTLWPEFMFDGASDFRRMYDTVLANYANAQRGARAVVEERDDGQRNNEMLVDVILGVEA